MIFEGLVLTLFITATINAETSAPLKKNIEVVTVPPVAVSSKHTNKYMGAKDGLPELQLKAAHPLKKVEITSVKKDSLNVKAVIKDEGTSGVLKKTVNGGTAVPPQKYMSDDLDGYEVISSRKSKRDEGGIDFDEDSALSGRKLRGAATAQASRTSVKKGPNGQDYEYEYVYYYYDDEDEDGAGKEVKSNAANAAGTAPTTTPQNPPPVTTKRAKYAEVERDRDETVGNFRGSRTEIPETKRPTVSAREQPHQERNFYSSRVEESPLNSDEVVTNSRRRQEQPKQQDKSRTRYTTIERGRGGGSGSLLTTIEPGSNEVLPHSRGGSTRSRGRIAEPIEDERLPQNTRFPSRGRGSGGSVTTPSSAITDQPVQSSPKSRGGSVRRPGVSLVDSSSFRTHSSDMAPDFDQGPVYNRDLANDRGADLYEIRPTTFSPPQPITEGSPRPTQRTDLPSSLDQDAPSGNGDKAALDLYAILQQTQEENSVTQDEEPSNGNTELLTTEILTTTTLRTTTTPTTTTTTTTTTTEAPQPSVRGRFRGAGGVAGNARIRPRLHSSSTTTSTEAAKPEEPPKRTKFSPSHNRNPSQVSAYGRRGSQRSTTTAAPVVEVSQPSATPSRPRPNFAGGNRYRTRTRPNQAPTSETAATASNEEHSPKEESAVSTFATPATLAGSSPFRPRLKVGGPRPLRPGPRINLKGRPGATSTAIPPVQQTEPAPTEPVQDAVTTTPADPEESEAGKRKPLRIRPGSGGRPLPGDPSRRRPLPGRRITLPTPQPQPNNSR